MKLYHLLYKSPEHDVYDEFVVYEKSHQDAFNLAKKLYGEDDDYYFDDNISRWQIEAVELDKPKVVQWGINYG